MPVTITRVQRDAIYELVIARLTAIGDVWLSIKRREFAHAKKMGREFAEDLRLLEDLGWAEAIDRDTVSLTQPPEELTSAFARLHTEASTSVGAYVSRPKDEEGLAERDLAACDALGAILSRLAQPIEARDGDVVTTAKPATESAVVKALVSGSELTGAEIAADTGLGRSTVGKALAALERRGMVRRHPGGRDGRRRLPGRWSAGQTDDGSSTSATQRLRPGQLDELVLDYINSQGAAVGATVVAKALGRSGGAVGNCLSRLAAAGRVRKVSDKPRRYSSIKSAPREGARAARPRGEKS